MAVPGNPIITDLPNEGGRTVQMPIYDQQQAQVPSTLIEAGGRKLANPTEGFQPYEDYATRLFKQNIIPGIGNQFLTGGNRDSSAFQGALGSAGSDLASRLAVAKANYGLQNEEFGARLLGQGMVPLYNQSYEKPYSAAGEIGQNVGQTLPALLKAYAEAPGSNYKDKLNALFGTGAAADTAKTAAQTASTVTDGVKAVQASKDAIKTAASTVGGATVGGTIAGKAATTGGTIAGKTGTTVGGAATTAGGFSALEATIAPALAAVGAVAMPVAVAGLFGWWLYKLIND